MEEVESKKQDDIKQQTETNNEGTDNVEIVNPVKEVKEPLVMEAKSEVSVTEKDISDKPEADKVEEELENVNTHDDQTKEDATQEDGDKQDDDNEQQKGEGECTTQIEEHKER